MITKILKDAFSQVLVGFIIIFFIQSLITINIGFWISTDDIENGKITFLPICKILEKTGQPCHTCGITRGFISATHFDFQKATKYNSYSVPFFFFELSIILIGFSLMLWKYTVYKSQ